MLSVIVCSANKEKVELLRTNIADTIGCDYELIWVGNDATSKGICELYNEGAEVATGDILCFCHDDIIFNSKDWGLSLASLCSNQHIGLVGVAGAIYKSRYPTSWVDVPIEYYRINLMQQTLHGSIVHRQRLDVGNYSEVAVLDGCFISGRADIFKKFKWDQLNLTGFHLYDIDISMRVKQEYKLVIANEIVLTHCSEGTFGKEWLLASKKIHKLNGTLLPSFAYSFSPAEKSWLEYYSLSQFIYRLIDLKHPMIKVLKYVAIALLNYPLRRANYSLLKKLIAYSWLTK